MEPSIYLSIFNLSIYASIYPSTQLSPFMASVVSRLIFPFYVIFPVYKCILGLGGGESERESVCERERERERESERESILYIQIM